MLALKSDTARHVLHISGVDHVGEHDRSSGGAHFDDACMSGCPAIASDALVASVAAAEQVEAHHALAANESGDDAPKRRLARVVGPRLSAAREFAGLSQTAAATLLGYGTPAQLSQQEMGRRLTPLPELIRAAEIYGTSTDYLLGLTNQPERDPARALRAATVRGLRCMLNGLAERLTDDIGRFAALCGPDATTARAVVGAGTELLHALGAMQRRPEFDDVPGGATLTRIALEFESRLAAVRVAIERFDALDLALRERFRAAVAANDDHLDAE